MEYLELFHHYKVLSGKYPVYSRIHTALQGIPKKYELLSTLVQWQESTRDTFERVALRVAIRNVQETKFKPGRKPTYARV